MILDRLFDRLLDRPQDLGIVFMAVAATFSGIGYLLGRLAPGRPR